MRKITKLYHCLYFVTYGLFCFSYDLKHHDISPIKEDYHESDYDRALIGQNVVARNLNITSAEETVTSCGTKELSPEELEEIEQEIAAALSSTQIASGSPTGWIGKTIVIKTYFHVIYEEGPNNPTNVSEALIEQQMEVLNNYYGGRSSIYKDCQGNPKVDGLETPFVFIKKGQVNRIQNSVWHKSNRDDDKAMKAALRKGTCADLNVYIKDPPSNDPKRILLGYGAFPWDCTKKVSEDGIVLKWNTLPGTVPEGKNGGYSYSTGVTLVHEVGHWLGLYHTFQDGCKGGDYVSDTPAQAIESKGCNLSQDTCKDSEGLDPVTNFMDYSSHCCENNFTPGQSVRMLKLAPLYRNLSPQAPPTLPPNCPVNQVELLVSLFTDDKPEETSWIFVEASGRKTTVVTNYQVSAGQAKMSLLHIVCVRAVAQYFLIVSDSKGDGMIGKTTNGTWSVLTSDPFIIGSGGKFKYHQIAMAGSPKKCSRGYKNFLFLMATDNSPSETSWALKMSSGTIVAKSPLQSYPSSSLVFFEQCLRPNLTYVFEVYDSGDDGLCCVNGQGFIEVQLDGVRIEFIEDEDFAQKSVVFDT